MKLQAIAPFALSACLFAQAASQVPIPGAAPAAPAAQVADSDIVIKVNGKDMTAGEVRKLVAGSPPQIQQAMLQNPGPALEYLFMMQRLEDMAKTDKVMDKSPWKEQIAFTLRQLLAQAEVNYRMNDMAATEAEEKAIYDANPSKYEQAKIRVIYVAFSSDPNAKRDDGKKPLTEVEAKGKAEDLMKQLRAGADFAKLAKENSDDKSSADKGGDFGVIRQGDPLAPEIKTAVFQTKAGEITGPVRQANGFYVIKVDERSPRPFAEVRDDLAQQVKQEKFQKWMKSLQEQNKVVVSNPDFFKSGAVNH